MKSTIPFPHTASVDDVERIAGLVANARPDWDASLVRVVLLSHMDQVDATDLAVAAIRAAQNPDYRTPKAIGWRGPHWQDTITKPIQFVRETARCGVCGKVESRCYSERPGADDHEFEAKP